MLGTDVLQEQDNRTTSNHTKLFLPQFYFKCLFMMNRRNQRVNAIILFSIKLRLILVKLKI